MANKVFMTFSVEVELEDVAAAQQFNERWESRSGAVDGPEVSPPAEREVISRASARLVAQAFTSRRTETGLILRSLQVLD